MQTWVLSFYPVGSGDPPRVISKGVLLSLRTFYRVTCILKCWLSLLLPHERPVASLLPFKNKVRVAERLGHPSTREATLPQAFGDISRSVGHHSSFPPPGRVPKPRSAGWLCVAVYPTGVYTFVGSGCPGICVEVTVRETSPSVPYSPDSGQQALWQELVFSEPAISSSCLPSFLCSGAGLHETLSQN